MSTLLWFGIGYLSGSLPFAVWLGRWWAGRDVQATGDGNPGAANAFKVGGWRLGVAVLVLDYLKGALPVGLAHYVFGISGWALAGVAVAPVVGHAFSLFLNFRGGKGLTVTFGIWSGLTLAQAPLVLGLLMAVFFFTITVNAWAVVFSLLGLLVYLVSQPADAALWLAWALNFAVLVWMHRHELLQPPRLKPLLSGRSRG